VRNALSDLPSSWGWVTVNDVCEVSGGLTKNSKRNGILTQVPYLRVANVYANRLDLRDVKDIGVTPSEIERVLLHRGDLLIVEGNGSVDQIGRVAIWNGAISPCVHQNHIIKARSCPSGLKMLWVLYWLLSPAGRKSVVSMASSTSGLHTLSLSKVRSLPLPLAPLSEQCRVVSEIEKHITRLDAAVASLERVKSNLKRARASVLKAAVEGRLVPTEAAQAKVAGRSYESGPALLERILAKRECKHQALNGNKKYKRPVGPNAADLVKLPEGWTWATIDQCSAVIRNGYSSKPEGDGNVPILRISAVRPGMVDRNEARALRGALSDYLEYVVHPGDLLFTRYNGTRALVGVCGLVREGEPIVYPDKLIRVVLLPLVSAAFFEKAANAGASRAFINQKIRTTAGQCGISGGDIKQVPVPLPPLAEQHRIVAEVERRLSVLDALEQVANRNLTRCNRLRQTILKRAFEGKLVPQNPDDEPAEELLARIRAQTA
jgi:type I restriction enzyme S subunit